MRKTAIAVMFMLAVPAARAGGLSAEQVTEKLQKMYENTRDFKAAFRQEYHSRALDRDKVSSGFVYVKKPGKMRWDYLKPREKHFVVDGKALYIYDPELEQVMVDRSFSGSDLSCAITFLWGKGKLKDEFQISFPADAGKADEHHYMLELTPKSKARFKKLWFKVERKTFRVVETLVEDPGGNLNRIIFSDMTTNVGLSDESFRFQIPKGLEVIEAPGK